MGQQLSLALLGLVLASAYYVPDSRVFAKKATPRSRLCQILPFLDVLPELNDSSADYISTYTVERIGTIAWPGKGASVVVNLPLIVCMSLATFVLPAPTSLISRGRPVNYGRQVNLVIINLC